MTIQATGKATTSKSTFRMQVGASTTIQAAPATIWALLTDAQNFTRWNSTVKSLQGTIAPGETVRLVAFIAPTRTFKLRVTTFQPNERMVWQDGTPLFKGVRVYTLAAATPGTTEVTMTETFSGPMLPMIASSLPDQSPSFERFLADLKQAAERGS